MSREGYVRGQQAEAARVDYQVGQEVVQSQVGAPGAVVDTEGLGEAVEKVQTVERSRVAP